MLSAGYSWHKQHLSKQDNTRLNLASPFLLLTRDRSYNSINSLKKRTLFPHHHPSSPAPRSVELQPHLQERRLEEAAASSSSAQLPVLSSAVGTQHECSVWISHRDNFRDQVHPRCRGRWEQERRGEERTHPPTDPSSPFLTKHLPFISTQVNPSRTGSAKRGKLAFERLAVSANWSQT